MLLHLGLLLHLGPNVITLRTFSTFRTSYYTCVFNTSGDQHRQLPRYGGISDTSWMSVSRLMIEEVPAPSQQSPPGVPEVPRSRQPTTLDVTARGWGKGSPQPRPQPLAITSRAVAAESEEPGTQPSSPWREEIFCLASILWAE